MTEVRIIVSPSGYDDVATVLREQAEQSFVIDQLADAECGKLADPDFLATAGHVFVNCHPMFESVPVSPQVGNALRLFVESGGTLYASDWASAVIESAFRELTTFSPRDGAAGTINARVSDPALAKSLGSSATIRFDLGQWVRMESFPAKADVYLRGDRNEPLAVGFRIGNGRVVFTSFHHHAQAQGNTEFESRVLGWLVTLATQHRNLLATEAAMAAHRVTGARQFVGRVGAEPEPVSVGLGQTTGLGVFALSWNKADHIELTLRYLRRREVAEAERRAQEPPLMLTVRDPGEDDAVEIATHAMCGSNQPITSVGYALSMGIQSAPLGGKDGFAYAFVQAILELGRRGKAPGRGARLTAGKMHEIAGRILESQGYQVHRRRRGLSRRPAPTRAQPRAGDERPAIQLEVVVDRAADRLTSHPIDGDLPGFERLLVVVSMTPTDRNELQYVGLAPDQLRSSQGGVIWRREIRNSDLLGPGYGTVSAQGRRIPMLLTVNVYRALRIAPLSQAGSRSTRSAADAPIFDVVVQAHDAQGGSVRCHGYARLAATQPTQLLVVADQAKAAARDDLVAAVVKDVDTVALADGEKCWGPGGLRCVAIGGPAARHVLVVVAGDTAPSADLDRFVDGWLGRGWEALAVFWAGRNPDDVLPRALRHQHAPSWQNDIREVADDVTDNLLLRSEDRRVFISYAHADGERTATRLADLLGHHRFEVFLDRFRLLPGVDFVERIADELVDKAMVVVVETPQSVRSVWVRQEVATAVTHRLGIAAVHLDGGPVIGEIAESARIRVDDDAALVSFVVAQHRNQLRKRRESMLQSVWFALRRASSSVSVTPTADGFRAGPTATGREYALSVCIRPADLHRFRRAHERAAAATGVIVHPSPIRADRRRDIEWLTGNTPAIAVDEGLIGRAAGEIAAGRL